MSSLGRASLLCLLLLPAAAMADEFDDFRIPEHKVFSWTGDLAGSASRATQSYPAFEGKAGAFSGAAGSTVSWLHDSDPRLWSLLLQLRASGDRSNNEETFFSSQDATRQRSTLESWRIAASDRRYPTRLPLAFQLDVDLEGEYLQSWLNQSQRIEGPPGNRGESRHTVHRQSYMYTGVLGATLGAGRVRDATSVYDVFVLEQRLQARGVLRGPLDSRTRERLAQLMYERGDYHAVLDRPARWFWERAIDILRDDPNFSAELDAVSLLRVLEPYMGTTAEFDFLPRPPIARLRGFFAGVATVAQYRALLVHFAESDFFQQTINDTLQPPFSSEASSDDHGDNTEIDVGPRVEWHHPAGPRWQWDAFNTVLFQAHGRPGGFRSNTTGTVKWIVADRWLASASANHQVLVQRDRSGVFDNYAWQVAVDASLAWYIEDHLQLTLSGNARQGRFGSYRRDEGIRFGIGYRFAGRIESPGLAEPIRVP